MAARYLTVTWEAFHQHARTLAARAWAHGPYRGIVAISRGGLVPAAILARVLNRAEDVFVVSGAALNKGKTILLLEQELLEALQS